MRVLVTGATGFVGSALLLALQRAGISARAAVRRPPGNSLDAHFVQVGDIGPDTTWSAALEGVSAVIHLAARVHVMNERAQDVYARYQEINVDATRTLAEQARQAGVRRFVFVSSIKVNGEATYDRPFLPEDPPAPRDAYAQSKLDAELQLARLASRDFGVVIVRPPLVYGPGVKGNLRRLCALAMRGVPVPIGSIHNRRDLIGLENLADVLVRCATHPRAAGNTFLVCDGRPISTPELFAHIARCFPKTPRMVPVPLNVLRLICRLAGFSAEFERLAGSLEIDSTRARTVLDWLPPVSTEDGIAAMVHAYKTEILKGADHH